MAAETAEMKNVRESAESRGEQLDPVPGMAVISCAASELIATRNYSNVTVGPIVVKRMVPDDDNLKAEIQKTQALCEEAVSEERQTVHAWLRAAKES